MSGISKRSLFLLGIGLAAVVLTWVATRLLGVDSAATVAVSDIVEFLVIAAAAVTALACAWAMGAGPLRTQWMLIGVGMVSFAVGDAVWAYIEVGLRQEVPYPGPSDFFYLAEYPFLAAGILMAGLGFRAFLNVKRPLLISGAATAVIAVALWVGLVSGLVADTAVPLAQRALDAFYPLADVLFLFGPAVFTLLVVGQLQGGRLGWPWLSVAAGSIVLAASDSVYSWLNAADAYQTGMITDFGWMTAHVLIAFGALITLDLAGATMPVAAPLTAEGKTTTAA